MFYEKYCAKMISDMTQIVVAVGLVTILSNFVRVSVQSPQVLGMPDFWQRSFLVATTILFTAYHLLAYAADSAAPGGDVGWRRRSRGPVRIIFLFIIDLSALAAMGAMYGVLAVGDVPTTESFLIDWRSLVWLAGLAASWHFAIALWHLVAVSRWQAWGAHFLFAGAQVSLSCIAAYEGKLEIAGAVRSLPIGVWSAVFAVVIGLLYFSRGRRILRQALSTTEQESVFKSE